MACGTFAEEIKKKLKTFGFEITREMETEGGCVINFRDPKVFKGVSQISKSSAIYDATGAVTVSDDGKIDVNIPIPFKAHIEWYITAGDKMYIPHAYLRDKYGVFGIKGNNLDYGRLIKYTECRHNNKIQLVKFILGSV